MASLRKLSKFLAALAVVQPACATSELSRAPAHPDEAWTLPEDSDYVKTLRDQAPAYTAGVPVENGLAGVTAAQAPIQPAPAEEKNRATARNRALFQPGRRYTLAELIDIAERHNPETRAAWEEARQAALAVGIAESSYLPVLSASVVGGYQYLTMPMPKIVAPRGFIPFKAAEILPTLAAKWLLFDFGKREGEVDEAKAKSLVANVAFTSAHEELLYGVSRSYFTLDAARASVRVAQDALGYAQRTQAITEAKHGQGLATAVDVAQARRQTAQAQFELVRARGGERTAYGVLVASMGVVPPGIIEIADSSDREIPAAPLNGVRALVERALVSRPDVVAALGKVRAAEAGLRQATAAYWPSIGVKADGFYNIGEWSTGGAWYSVARPNYSALLNVEVALFDGGAREARIAAARSGVSAALAALDGARNRAVSDVTTAYDGLQTSVAEYQAAVAVGQSAVVALTAALDAYSSGIGPLTDVLTAQNGASMAQMQRETSRASVFTSAAALAFAVGSVTRR